MQCEHQVNVVTLIQSSAPLSSHNVQIRYTVAFLRCKCLLCSFQTGTSSIDLTLGVQKVDKTFISTYLDMQSDFTLKIRWCASPRQRYCLNCFIGCLWRQNTFVTTHIYNISQTISDRSVKFWLCFLSLQDMHTSQLQKKNIKVSSLENFTLDNPNSISIALPFFSPYFFFFNQR